jgi:hypothetical protein
VLCGVCGLGWCCVAMSGDFLVLYIVVRCCVCVCVCVCVREREKTLNVNLPSSP